MNVTQPTVSSAVLELEKSMGVQLFNRDNRHVALTTEGRLLLSYAVQVEDLIEEASERLQRSDLEPGGRLSVRGGGRGRHLSAAGNSQRVHAPLSRRRAQDPSGPPRAISSTIC